MKHSIYILSLVCLFTHALAGQSGKASASITYENPKADKLYSRAGYMAANELYRNESDKIKSNTEIQRKLAESYRLNGMSKEAELYYSKYVTPTSPLYDILHYAQVLLYNGKCKEASEYFHYYKAQTKREDITQLITDCDELTGFASHEQINYKNAEGLNSKLLDFCPAYYKNGLIFTSGRDASSTTKIIDNWTKKEFPDLYFAASLGNGKFGEPELLSWNLKTKYHDGAVSFSRNGNEMYYTTNNKNGKSKNGIKDLKIYIAERVGNEWETKSAFPFNSSEYATCHPALSSDGMAIVFSSDMPGGLGGMDLYVSKKDANGVWTTPQNLGKEINTTGNEIFPFLDQKNQLYYSSDGQKGLGGLDIFSASPADRELIWMTPNNMGIPFNSNKDDLCFISASGGREGYFTSNREGGVGEDDIYYWTDNSLDELNSDDYKILITVRDKETNETLKDVRLNLFNNESDFQSLLTNSDGTPGRTFKPDEFSFAQCAKQGYKPQHFYLTPEMVFNEELSTIYMEKEPLQGISGKVLDNVTKLPIPAAEIHVRNLETNENVILTTDNDGNYQSNLVCNNSYTMLSSKNNYAVNQIIIYSNEVLCGSNEPLKKDIFLDPNKLAFAKKDLSKKYLGDEKAEFKPGKSFEVKDIYYDYDKFNIRPDAALNLDDLVSLLKSYPAMEIELSSHTDSRGSDEYNQKLSQERAESAVKYIIGKGISEDRIKAAGYGEGMLKNGCKDGVECSEQEHQENRRTEVKILKM